MGIGKKNIPLPIVPPLAATEGVDQLFSSLQSLKRMLEISPGRCRLVASAAVTKHRAIYIANDQIQHADKDAPRVAVGLALQTVAAGELCDFMLLQGLVSGMAVGAGIVYYLGANGVLLNAPPGAGIRQPLGVGLSSRELLLSIGLP